LYAALIRSTKFIEIGQGDPELQSHTDAHIFRTAVQCGNMAILLSETLKTDV